MKNKYKEISSPNSYFLKTISHEKIRKKRKEDTK